MIVAFGNFSGVVWTENIWCISQSENAVFKFLRRNVDGKHLMRESQWKRSEISLSQYGRGLNFSIAKDPNSWEKSNLTEIPDKKNFKIWVYLV